MNRLDPVSSAERELTKRANTVNYHKTVTLNLKKVRTFIIEHPGCTAAEIREATSHGTMKLQQLGLAMWKRDENGVVRWYAKSGLSRSDKEDKK